LTQVTRKTLKEREKRKNLPIAFLPKSTPFNQQMQPVFSFSRLLRSFSVFRVTSVSASHANTHIAQMRGGTFGKPQANSRHAPRTCLHKSKASSV
jgi:hypothetical protein